MSFVKLGTKKEDQKDNKRQKLHGAFQGGFSAGYYNTVGSKEGWKPKQFTSSKSSNFTQSKTDFMDEEDYKEFGHVLINEEYAELGSTERELKRQKLKGIEIEEDFIVKNDEFGKNLLKLMIGSLKKEYNTVSVDFNDLGCSVHGRGFDPLKDAPEFKKKKHEVAPAKEKNKGGFGTGIFEYEDEYGDLDDYDIPSTQYDTVIFDEDDPLPTFTKKSSEKPVKLKGLLPGFKPAHEMKKCAPKIFLAPYPPKDYVPTPIFKKAVDESISKGINPLVDESKDSMKNSVFSYINMKNKQRLKSFVNNVSSLPKLSLTKSDDASYIYTVPVKTAENALLGFMPFGNDPPKQARYKNFLQEIVDAAKEPGNISEQKKKSATEAAETLEFSKAAMLYRPSSNMISSRFLGEGKGKIDLEPNIEQKIVYGKDTRRIMTWKPKKILCRRFAVRFKENSDIDSDDGEEDKEALNKETMMSLMVERDRLIESGEIGMTEAVVETELLTKEDMMNELHKIEDDIIEEEDEKPSMDLFKAIFADSDTESDQEQVNIPVEMTNITPPVEQVSDSPESELVPKWGPALPPNTVPEVPVSMTVEFNEPIVVEPDISKEEPKFRPTFTKPIKNSSSMNKPRQKSKRPIISLDMDDGIDEGELKHKKLLKKKIRPSAADFM